MLLLLLSNCHHYYHLLFIITSYSVVIVIIIIAIVIAIVIISVIVIIIVIIIIIFIIIMIIITISIIIINTILSSSSSSSSLSLLNKMDASEQNFPDISPIFQPCRSWIYHDVIEWKHFPRYWPFVRGIHRSPDSPHKTSDAARSFDIFYLRLKKRLSKPSRHRWYEMPSCSWWRHCNVWPICNTSVLRLLRIV